MAKTFASIGVGSYLNISRNEYENRGFANVHEYFAKVTNIDTYGDELIISFKTPQFNHTIKVNKTANVGYVTIYKHTWRNWEYKWRKYTKPNCSRRKYEINYNKVKYSYKIEII